MKLLITIWIFIVLLLSVWIIRWYYASKVERPQTNTVQVYDSFEIRTLPSQILATVTVTADNESQAAWKGFRALGGFIFWDNIRKDNIAMTAPVISQESSQNIAMTAPVTSQEWSNWTYDVAFIMPSKWTMETLPVPNNTQVKLSENESSTIAVRTFAWYARNVTVKKQKERFKAALEKESITTDWSFTLAQYNDPRTPPWMRTNELWIPLKQ